MENKFEIISLKQMPVINDRIKDAGKVLKERIDVLNLEKMVATDQTIQSLKSLRAELNKEFEQFEAERKAIKFAINKPYNDMEVIYKQEITGEYKAAIKTLKLKIDEFEIRVKDKKKEEVEKYFNELIVAEKIDFVKFDQVGLNITLSATEKKLKEEVLSFIERVKSDSTLIETQDYKTEIWVEYKTDLNVSRAITVVKDRKEKEAVQAELFKKQEIEKRKIQLVRECNMIFNTMTNSFIEILDKQHIITVDFLQTATDRDWDIRIEEIKKALKERDLLNKADVVALDAPNVIQQTVKPEILTARFEVKGTFDELSSLKEFLVTHGYKYTNI